MSCVFGSVDRVCEPLYGSTVDRAAAQQGSSRELALVVVPVVGEDSGVCVWVQGDATELGASFSMSATESGCHTGSPKLVWQRCEGEGVCACF